MKKRSLIKYSGIAVVFVALLISCEDQPTEQTPQGTAANQQERTQETAEMANTGTMPAASGDVLLNYITETNSYENWQLWPGTEPFYEGTEPHGALLTTYVNDKALDAISANEAELPEGSIIVKENYNPDKELVAVTTMYKIDNYNPEAGNWFWLKYNTDQEIEAEGKVNGCIFCHTKAKDTDYLFMYNR